MSETTSRLARDVLGKLHEKRDLPGVIRFTTQSVWLLASLVAIALFHERAMHAAMWAAILSAGAAHLTFFPAMHEAGHKTAFATSWLNEGAMWVCCILMLEGPTFFREFHWEHHRATQDREQDPEIAAAPALLDDWPSNPLAYLALVSGQALMLGKLGFTLACAFVPKSLGVWEKLFPFIPEKKRGRVAWECRAVLLVLGALGALGYTLIPSFPYMALSVVIGHVLLGFYLMAEHTGLPNSGTQTERTRTIETNAIVRWMMWNMPYHTAHHEHPAIPFHAIPEARADEARARRLRLHRAPPRSARALLWLAPLERARRGVIIALA